jgi:ribonuclease HI
MKNNIKDTDTLGIEKTIVEPSNALPKDNSTIGMVLWVDGSCRPTNPGNTGWGVHGYMYDTVMVKKVNSHPDHILTAAGYVLKAEALNNPTVKEVRNIHYIDGYGSVTGIATNNVGELAAMIAGLRHALDYAIDIVQVFTDSEYVRKGIEYANKWKTNNW